MQLYSDVLFVDSRCCDGQRWWSIDSIALAYVVIVDSLRLVLSYRRVSYCCGVVVYEISRSFRVCRGVYRDNPSGVQSGCCSRGFSARHHVFPLARGAIVASVGAREKKEVLSANSRSIVVQAPGYAWGLSFLEISSLSFLLNFAYTCGGITFVFFAWV